MVPEVTAEELSAALENCAAGLLARERITAPPVDAVALARRLGMSLAWDSGQPGRARIVRLASAGSGRAEQSILLRPEPRRERREWAVAHEIGEAHAHQVFDELGIDPRTAPPNSREQVACQLATRLLLPQAWFTADARACDWDLEELKRKYATASHELIARRMLDFAPPIVITIYDHGQITFRRSNGRGRCGPPIAAEVVCWREVHAGGRAVQINDADRVVRGWPIHEPAWKREIMRLEMPDESCC